MSVELTVITGMSGAGKSQAMGAFEDAGWFCVDNLPPGLLPALADLFLLDGSPVSRAAVVCDVRGGVYFEELNAVLDQVAANGDVTPRILFLEASDGSLVRRFKETRRRHPLAEDGSLLEGIERERGSLAELRARADVVIDTSTLNIWELRRAVSEALGPGGGVRMSVMFASFGYKHGIPQDADLLFDVRFLRNPHYVAELSTFTGMDPEVQQFVTASPGFVEFHDRLGELLDFLLPAYVEEGKSSLVVGFGCTGGRHRSVALAELLARRYGEDERFDVTTSHRHIRRPHVPPAAAR